MVKAWRSLHQPETYGRETTTSPPTSGGLVTSQHMPSETVGRRRNRPVKHGHLECWGWVLGFGGSPSVLILGRNLNIAGG